VVVLVDDRERQGDGVYAVLVHSIMVLGASSIGPAAT
jgi:hypothetical protein